MVTDLKDSNLQIRRERWEREGISLVILMLNNLFYYQWLLAYYYSQPPSTLGLSNIGLGLYLDGWPYSGMSISADSPSDETLNQGPLALLLRRQYEFPFLD